MAIFNAVLPVVTLIIGFLGNYFLESRRDRRTERRDRAARRIAREELERQQRLAFEREGLLEMHHAVRKLTDAAHALMSLIQRCDRDGKDWEDDAEAPAIRQCMLDANVARGHAATLLLDEPVIDAVNQLGEASFPMYMTKQSGRDPLVRERFYTAVDRTLEATAARIRSLYGSSRGPLFDEPESGKTP